MGTDIRLFVETRRADAAPWEAAGTWHPLGPLASKLRPNSLARERLEEWHADDRAPEPDVVLAAFHSDAPACAYQPAIYEGRSYPLFAALADVRNHFGIVPIATPRGMPKDASAEVIAEWARWAPDAGGVTHLGLDELTVWPGWTQTYEAEFGVLHGRRGRRLSDERLDELRRVADSLGELPNLHPNGWDITFGSGPKSRQLRFAARLDLAVGRDWWRYLVELHRFKIESDAHDIRLILWFDS